MTGIRSFLRKYCSPATVHKSNMFSHLIIWVGPVLDTEVTGLLVKWEERQIQFTSCGKVSTKRPHNFPIMLYMNPEVPCEGIMVKRIGTER